MKIKYILLIILLIATILRVWKLDSIPPHLTSDEAAIGYNAYSILKTGKDEYGEILPVIFKSFGDYKPGFYIYSAVPFVAILGLNELAVRLPSAISGTLTVYLIYLLTNYLFKNKKLGLLSAFLLAINPWAIHFSRGAWEVNLALTLTLAGIYFFLKSLQKEKYILLSIFFFALTLLTYQGAKLSTSIVVVILLILWGKDLLKFKRETLVKGILLGFIISLPILFSLVQGKASRLNVFSIFSYPRPREYLQTFLNQNNEYKFDLNYYLFHSESHNFLRGIMGRYFNHFSTRFLFFEGDWSNLRHSAPNHGMLLMADLILLITGSAIIAKSWNKKEYIFIWMWVLLSPLPAVLSRDQIHAVRSLNMVIPLVIILSLGMQILLTRKYIKYGFFAIYFLSFAYFLDAYFIHLSAHDSKYWEYGYKQIVQEITPIQNNYKKITVQQSYSQPYIYFLFFQKYDPTKYQQVAKLKESIVGDVGQVEHLDNICFCAVDWSVNRGDKASLIVGDPVRIPPEDSKDENQFKLIKEIKYLNNLDTAFRIIEVKQ